MTSHETVLVNIGDLVVYDSRPDANVAVVTEVRPHLHVADILDNSSGEEGLLLGLPGTVTNPVEVIGSIPLSDVVMGFVRQLKDPSAVSYDAELGELKKAEAEGPVEFPRLTLSDYEVVLPEKPEIDVVDINIAPKPDENPQLTQDLIRFILREIWGKSIPDQFEVNALFEQMKSRTTLIAFGEDGEILATGGIQKGATKDEMMIIDVAINPSSQGLGIGTIVMHSLEKIARAGDAKRVCLIAVNDTDEFYEREELGYQLDGNYHTKEL